MPLCDLKHKQLLLIVVFISQYIEMANQYVVQLKQIQCYLLIISQFKNLPSCLWKRFSELLFPANQDTISY